MGAVVKRFEKQQPVGFTGEWNNYCYPIGALVLLVLNYDQRVDTLII
jgi:hypothetical protein